MTFELEALYHRVRDIHQRYGGQRQGGISTPTAEPYIFIFTSDAGEQHGYADGFDENGLFTYTGEGQLGDMQFVRGNKALRDHVANGRSVLLFEASKRRGYYRFKGDLALVDYDDTLRGPDSSGNDRRLIRFRFIPASELSVTDAQKTGDETPQTEDVDAIDVLRERAYAAVTPTRATTSGLSKRNAYRRSQAVKDYVLARATGICECCSQPAPFRKKNGKPYLEPHHVRQLSDDGLDSPLWVAAICPTCHREIHHGENGESKNDSLKIIIQSKEKP